MKILLATNETVVASMPTRTAILIVVAAAAVLTGCAGGGPSKRQMANAINEAIKQKVCFSIQGNKPPTWPLRVVRPVNMNNVLGTPPLNPILAAMQAAGYLKITTVNDANYTEPVDVILPSPQAKKWWSIQNGFCVGTKAVADVQEWTIPNASDAMGPGQEMEVKYTWHLIDVPSWAKRPEFNNVPGMTKPVADSIILQKTNKGWEAAD